MGYGQQPGRVPDQPSQFPEDNVAGAGGKRIFTIGIRHFPCSRHNSQFNKPALEEAFAERGLEELERLANVMKCD